jgi:uncharacterized protein YjbI with pentapeptide repeats
MKVIKSQRIGVLTRPYEWRRELQLGVSLLAYVPLGERRELLPEVALWQLAGEEMGVPVIDEGIPKSRAEYLLAGSAFPALGELATECTVRATVAGASKSLVVTGDRRWDFDRMTPAQPYRSMPLEWRLAFGGASDPYNPLGRGADSVDVDGVPVHFLPNIEYPHELVRDRSARPGPAGFRALDVTWPQRAHKAGTYDDRWLKEGFPGFANDIDWSFFNVAPNDQRFERDRFDLDTAYEFHNMHPRSARIAGCLPNVRARCFVNRAGQTFERLEELPLRLTTLWFFPSRERAVLVYQGTVPVQEDDGSDITHLLAAAEDAAVEARGRDYYVGVITRRCDPKADLTFTLKDSDLCPEALCAPSEADPLQSEMTGEGLLNKRLERKRDRDIEENRELVRSYGLDPDQHAPLPAPPTPPPPTLEQLPQALEQAMAESRAIEEEQKRYMAKQDEENEELFKRLGLDYGVVRAEMAQEHRGPPTFSAEGQAEDLRQTMAMLAAQGLPTDHVQEILDDPEQRHIWQESERGALEMYRVSAHLQGAAPAQSPEANERARARLLALLAGGAEGCDLTGCDLTGLNLAGARLERALLESSKLAGCDLRGAKLAGAVLAHADLRGALLDGADLRNANLGGSQLEGASLLEAEFEGAVLARANLARARLDRAHFAQTDFSGARFQGTSFAGVRASQTIFMDCDLSGSDFSGALLTACNFLNVDVRQARFCGADVSRAVFVAAKGAGADFAEARLQNLRCANVCDFEGASFIGADLSEANLRGSKLRGAQFSKAKLDRADLSSADLTEAVLYQVSAVSARFVRAELTRARLIGANLMEAILASARIDGADLTGAHLFGADLSRLFLDDATRLEATILTRARIYPLRSQRLAPPPPRAGE